MLVARKDLTPEIVKEYLHYDPNTGYLTWIKKNGSKPIIGKRAGSHVKNRDNRTIHFLGEMYIEHRLIWFMQTGRWPNGDIDHIDHNECNNSWDNLREVSREENNCNMSLKKNNTSGVIGVYPNIGGRNQKTSPWMAEISRNGFRKSKSFHTKEEAIAWRKEMEKKLHFNPNHGIKKPVCDS